MIKAIRIHELGGPQALKWEDVEVGEPKEREIKVKTKVIGLNFIDVYFRKGIYKAPLLPFIPAAGGVGSLLCQWANALGATVIGTVSTQEKGAQAKDNGCHHVIIYKEDDFVIRVNEITSGKGVEVVYDSVGKDTFE